MIICKNFDSNYPINNDNWFKLCPPQKGRAQWKEGRSAMETANLWLKGIPNEFIELFKTINLTVDMLSPEVVSSFDSFGGAKRKHDLVIKGKITNAEDVVICIESKVDEPFNGRVKSKRKNENPKSNIPKRIDLLHKALFSGSPNIDDIYYQLLYAIGATLAEAKRNNTKKAFFVVQNLLTEKCTDRNVARNADALDDMVTLISNGTYTSISDGQLLKIGTVPGNDFIPHDVELFIGKYSVILP